MQMTVSPAMRRQESSWFLNRIRASEWTTSTLQVRIQNPILPANYGVIAWVHGDVAASAQHGPMGGCARRLANMHRSS